MVCCLAFSNRTELRTLGLGQVAESSQSLSRVAEDLSTAKSWFDTCRDEHRECRDERPPWFPTRLLDIGTETGSVRLIVTADATPKGPYMTLSHRWSSETYTKLQSSTIAQLQTSVDVMHLPKSFQDAIRIARHLGVGYIWIDSLCIKQDKDDLSDWVLESRKMSQVYSYACLNISSTRSVDGTENLLGESCWAASHPTRIELAGTDGISQAYYLVNGELWEDEVEHASLASRGWVFQERYLARKVLHFGSTQLGWECRQSRALSLFTRGLPVSLGVAKSKRSDMRLDATASLGGSPTLDTTFAEGWAEIINQYSSCDFTYTKDKLVALEGIAIDTMAVRKHDTYAAGMWKSSAVIDLAWWRDDEDCKQYPAGNTAGRAPSWSWASADGEINFPVLHSEYSGLRETYAEVIDINSKTRVDQATVITEGSIILQCLCLPMTLDFTNDEPTAVTVEGMRFSGEDENIDNLGLPGHTRQERTMAIRCMGYVLHAAFWDHPQRVWRHPGAYKRPREVPASRRGRDPGNGTGAAWQRFQTRGAFGHPGRGAGRLSGKQFKGPAENIE